MKFDSSYFELRRFIDEAMKSGKYFITVTFVDGKELKHYYLTQRFPKDDLIPTLEHIAQQVSEAEAINE